MRFLFEVAYHGKKYNGWQSQQNALGVQEVIEDACAKIFAKPTAIVGSGRTDTGVHCEQQFFHADIDIALDSVTVLRKLNSLLPRDIALKSVRAIRDDASARYDATMRRYRYQISLSKNPFMEDFAWHIHKLPDIDRMNEAATLLLGEQDFECFSKVKTDVNHFRCSIHDARWTRTNDLLCFHISANRFLRGMVRAIVGTLVDTGFGKTSVEEFRQIIIGKDRRRAGQNVPPHGLFLCEVQYPESIFI